MTPTLSGTDLVKGLHDLGLEAGMGLIVHSSLRSFGHVEGGAATVIGALMEVLTPEGMLLMPSFNHGAPFGPSGPGFYHPGETPTTNGAIPDAFWRMPGVARSLNPTHAFAAWGAGAERATSLHHRTLTMGPDSPLGMLHSADGYALLLGVGYGSNTFHHAVEMATHAPCLGRRTEAYPVVLPDGRRAMGRTWGWRGGICPFTDGNRYADDMVDRQRVAMIGSCRAILYRLRAGYDVVSSILAKGKAGFPPCRDCAVRPRRVPETVASDWDVGNARLLPDSESLSY